jgi:hypothetical protein
MLGKCLLIVAVAGGLAAAQEITVRPDDGKDSKEAQQPQLRWPQLPVAPNARELAERLRSEAKSAGRCSIPLVTIVPKNVPYMPMFKPPAGIDEGISRLQMPAPPCDEEQRWQLESKRTPDGR